MGVDLEFNGTYFRDRFFYEYKIVPQLHISKLPRLYFGFAVVSYYSFSTQTQEQVTAGFIGPNLGFKKFSSSYSQVEFLWKIDDNNNILGTTNTKLGISNRRNNINLGIAWYDLLSSDQIFALSIGFSF